MMPPEDREVASRIPGDVPTREAMVWELLLAYRRLGIEAIWRPDGSMISLADVDTSVTFLGQYVTDLRAALVAHKLKEE